VWGGLSDNVCREHLSITRGGCRSGIMKSQFRFVFVVLYLTAVLVFTAHLRSTGNRIFYKLWNVDTERSRLKQQLWQKQLRLESLINPDAVSQRLGE
jgi:hypothetical protein